MQTIWLGLGANTHGHHGAPLATFYHALCRLERLGLSIFAYSDVFLTKPLGPVRQADFHNAVVGVRGSIGPAALLRLVKGLERDAGRRAGTQWGPRPLDIDILDFGGRILAHPATQTHRGRLCLPHPAISERGFVLLPLSEVAPYWRHPISGRTAASLLAIRPQSGRHLRRLPLSLR